MKASVLREAIDGKSNFEYADVRDFLIENGFYDPQEEKHALEHYREMVFRAGLRQLKKGGHREIVSTEVELPDGTVERRWFQPELCQRPQLEYLRRYAIHQVDYWMREANHFTRLINNMFGGQLHLPFPEEEAA